MWSQAMMVRNFNLSTCEVDLCEREVSLVVSE